MSPRTRIQHTSFAARVGAALLALLFVWGELSAFAHFVFAEHHVCPEHGTLEESCTLDAPETAAPFAPTASAHTTPSCVARKGSAHVDVASDSNLDESKRIGPFFRSAKRTAHHDDCAFTQASLTARVAFESLAYSTAPNVQPADPVTVDRAEDTAPYPVYLLAPKQSPPAV